MRVQIIKDFHIANVNLKGKRFEVQDSSKSQYMLKYYDLSFWISKNKTRKIGD